MRLLSAIIALACVARTVHAEERAMPDPTREEAAMPYNPDGQHSPGGQPAAAIEGALRQHQSALLAIPGVTGVAVGKSPTGDPAIVVYLLHSSDRSNVPQRLGSHPVVVQVTGPIEAQPR
jgi:hypothetical protein